MDTYNLTHIIIPGRPILNCKKSHRVRYRNRQTENNSHNTNDKY